MRVAIVGTDTGVGKTIITAGVVGALRERGCDARAVKPAQTGYPPDDDADVIATVCGNSDAAVCLRYLEEPLAPAVAAEREDVDLSYHAIREEAAAALDDAAVGVLEGIGGLRVPLAEQSSAEVVDLVDDLECSAVVVASSGLGTLNHTALTIEALRRRDVPVVAVVLNQFEGDSIAERSNPETLRSMIDTPVLTMPTVERAELIETVDERLASLIEQLYSQ